MTLTMLSAVSALRDPTGALTQQQWSPDPRLNQTDSDITLMMLSQNDIAYVSPSDDPWMPAHLHADSTNLPEWIGEHDVWYGDYYVNLLGCIDQYQICNPNKDGSRGDCTKLAGQISVVQDVETLGFNLAQLWTVNSFLERATYRGIYYAVEGRGAAALNGYHLPSR